MKNKKILILCYIVTLAVGYYIGQKSNSHLVQDTKHDTTTDTSKNTHKETKEIEETAPDGTKKKTKIITEDTNTEKKKTDEIVTHKEETITQPKKTLHVNALAGLDTSRAFTPVYGASVSKEFIGPVTLGAFGLTNGTVGISVGVAF